MERVYLSSATPIVLGSSPKALREGASRRLSPHPPSAGMGGAAWGWGADRKRGGGGGRAQAPHPRRPARRRAQPACPHTFLVPRRALFGSGPHRPPPGSALTPVPLSHTTTFLPWLSMVSPGENQRRLPASLPLQLG